MQGSDYSDRSFGGGEMGLEFYQLVQAAVYYADGLWEEATFDLCFKNLPEHVGYALCAGVDDAVDSALALEVTSQQIEYLGERPEFARISPGFFEHLADISFSGNIWAMPEGSVVFPHEPIIRLTAPLVEAALLEAVMLQRLGLPSAVATRASRMVEAARGKRVVDFSMRRWFSDQAALAATRAACMAGLSATVDLSAAAESGIEPMGTMAGTYLAVYGDERVAFDALHQHFPGILHLVLPEDDPRDSMARFSHLLPHVKTVQVQHRALPMAVRLVREALDARGMSHVRILGSGAVDEFRIAKMLDARVPVDAFTVGNTLAAGNTDLMSRLAFTLAARYSGGTAEPALGRSAALYPGEKQVLRMGDHDLLCLERDLVFRGRDAPPPMLRPVVMNGVRVREALSLAEATENRKQQVSALPAGVRRVTSPDIYPVHISDSLAALALG